MSTTTDMIVRLLRSPLVKRILFSNTVKQRYEVKLFFVDGRTVSRTIAGDDLDWPLEVLVDIDRHERFASFGETVLSGDVPELVRAGREVWSFGYGDDPDEFTVITAEDLWAWEGNTVDPSEMWGPFRVAPE